MTTRLIVIFLFTNNISSAQVKPVPTQFDKFVNKSRIEWAAYASDTFSFTGFNTLLLNRLNKKQIKASLPIDSRSPEAKNIKYVPLDSIEKAYFNGELKKFDTTKFSISEVTQILYIEDGKLKSYIPWVTPTLPVYLSSGKYIGERFYFNSAYNYKYDRKPRKTNKQLFLGQTKKMMKLDAEPVNKLKELYGRNLLQTIWPALVQNGTKLYSMDGKELDATTIDIKRTDHQPPQPIPTWDSAGAIQKWVVTYNEAYSGQYTDLQLVQDWYYDHKKNILNSYIREMFVYATRKPGEEAEKIKVPVLKLVFK